MRTSSTLLSPQRQDCMCRSCVSLDDATDMWRLQVQAVLNDMESKYKKIWDTDKDAYMRRYRKSPGSRDFDGDIKLYLDHIDEIRGEESTVNLDFLHIDQQPIKAVRAQLVSQMHAQASGYCTDAAACAARAGQRMLAPKVRCV